MFKVNDYVIYKRDVCIILEEKIISNYEYFVLQSTIDEALDGRFIEQSASEIADLIKGTNSSYSPGAWLGAGLSGVSSVIKSTVSKIGSLIWQLPLEI